MFLVLKVQSFTNPFIQGYANKIRQKLKVVQVMENGLYSVGPNSFSKLQIQNSNDNESLMI